MSASSLPPINTSTAPPRPISAPQSTTTTSDDDDDLSTLPYPTELPRAPFLDPDFSPQTYLATLHNRHQTLEDLRADLRARSQLLSRELLDLVNGNYETFLSLGGELRGGGERVEGVRVGVLGFEREVEGVRKVVREREREVGGLLAEKKEVRRAIVLGRAVVEVEESLRELEERLGIVEAEGEDELESVDDGDEDEEETPEAARLRRLERHVRRYVLLLRQMERIGRHPFLEAQRSRVAEVRKTLLLDLAAALRQAKGAKLADEILKVVKMYGEMDAEADAVRVLRAG